MFEQLEALDAELDSRKKYTTIFKVGITKDGQFCVGRNQKPISGWLDKEEILKRIEEIEYAPVTCDDPFFVTVYGRQRLVFTLGPSAWFFQPTLAPFTLKTPDPYNNFTNQVKLGDDPLNMGRSKTIYVDDDNKVADQIYTYNLLIDIWQDITDYNSARTPVVIDPDVGNGGGGNS
jgi:hypothetical protein